VAPLAAADATLGLAQEEKVEEPTPSEVSIYSSAAHTQCRERALVLEAVGIDYRLERTAGAYGLIVQAGDETRALAELEAHERENQEWQAPAPPLPARANGWSGVLVYCVLLSAVAMLERRYAFGCDWLTAGRMQAGLVCQGEWWRTVTALTLHADGSHLVGNLAFGILFGVFVGQLLGSGFAWFSILIAGACGNALNAWIQPATHNAVGASTALFAALGLLSAYTWRRQRNTEHRWTRRLAPLAGGVALLGLTGSGGEGTDVIAHLTGFFSGLMLGAIYGSLANRLRLNAPMQLAFGSLSIGLLSFAWLCALRAQFH